MPRLLTTLLIILLFSNVVHGNKDFPDYVAVNAVGAAQINDYEEVGYELIVLTD